MLCMHSWSAAHANVRMHAPLLARSTTSPPSPHPHTHRMQRALQLLADPSCWGPLHVIDDPTAPQPSSTLQPPCSVGPLALLTMLCRQHPPALSLALARLCAVEALADNCVAALAGMDEWAAVPLIG